MGEKAVVEFHGFRDNNNLFIVKELAIVGDSFQTQVLFKPPYDQSVLNAKMQTNNRWLSRHVHGIRWEEGDVPYDEEIIRNLCKPFTVIYTKGLEKVKFLQNLHPEVRDLNTKTTQTSDPELQKIYNILRTISPPTPTTPPVNSQCLVRKHNSDTIQRKCALRSAISGYKSLTQQF